MKDMKGMATFLVIIGKGMRHIKDRWQIVFEDFKWLQLSFSLLLGGNKQVNAKVTMVYESNG